MVLKEASQVPTTAIRIGHEHKSPELSPAYLVQLLVPLQYYLSFGSASDHSPGLFLPTAPRGTWAGFPLSFLVTPCGSWGQSFGSTSFPNAGSKGGDHWTPRDSPGCTISWSLNLSSKKILRASLVVQWLRIHLAVQTGSVPSLGRTYVSRNIWVTTTEPKLWSSRIETAEPTWRNSWSHHALQLMLCNKRSHCNEKLLHPTRKSLGTATKAPYIPTRTTTPPPKKTWTVWRIFKLIIYIYFFLTP